MPAGRSATTGECYIECYDQRLCCCITYKVTVNVWCWTAAAADRQHASVHASSLHVMCCARLSWAAAGAPLQAPASEPSSNNTALRRAACSDNLVSHNADCTVTCSCSSQLPMPTVFADAPCPCSCSCECVCICRFIRSGWTPSKAPPNVTVQSHSVSGRAPG